MTFEKCSDKTKVKILKLEEKKAVIYFDNEEKDLLVKTKFDGCVVKNQTASDYVVTKPDVGQVIVELKGVDVDRAAEQIIAVAQYLIENDLRTGALGGLIVGRRYPRVDTKLQRKQAEFNAKYKSPMKYKPYGEKVTFEWCLSFRK